MRDLLTDPACREEDLGQPLPDSPHAVSVAMPRWDHVVAYEREDPAILRRLRCGYPRFLVHPMVEALFERASRRFAGEGEVTLVFPSSAVAGRASAFLGGVGRRDPFGWQDLTALTVPEARRRDLLAYWRFSGEIISSRQAEWATRGEAPPPAGREAAERLRNRLAEFAGQQAEDVFLFGSGMEATFTVHRMLQEFAPGKRSLQLEFPYVDVLKVQSRFGAGEHFIPVVGEGDWDSIGHLVRDRSLCGVFTELASNPLMRCIDLARLARTLREGGIPLVIDDTVACVVNADVFPFADLVTTSLTKYLAGTGDVMGGSIIVNRDAPEAGRFRDWLRAHGDSLWQGDAEVLEQASRDVENRVRESNRGAERLVALLRDHPKVARVHHPSVVTPEWFDQIRRVGGGGGGLLSMELDDPARTAPAFFDALEVSKGPSFGTRFTLACPYTLLAHFHELEWAERCGVSRWLVRVGVGVEEPDDLEARFLRALEAC